MEAPNYNDGPSPQELARIMAGLRPYLGPPSEDARRRASLGLIARLRANGKDAAANASARSFILSSGEEEHPDGPRRLPSSLFTVSEVELAQQASEESGYRFDVDARGFGWIRRTYRRA